MFNFQDAMAKSLANSGVMSQLNQKALDSQKGYAFQMPGSAGTADMSPIIMQAAQLPSAPNITYTLNQLPATPAAPVILPTPAPAQYTISMPQQQSVLQAQPTGPAPTEQQAPAPQASQQPEQTGIGGGPYVPPPTPYNNPSLFAGWTNPMTLDGGAFNPYKTSSGAFIPH
jgi:hypothetical protein